MKAERIIQTCGLSPKVPDLMKIFIEAVDGLIEGLASCRENISGFSPFTHLGRTPVANGHNWHFLVSCNSACMPEYEFWPH